NFFIKKERVADFCEKLIRRQLNLKWDAGAHAALLLKAFDKETLSLVKESGCAQIYIGAETGSDDMLTAMEKKSTVKDTYDFVRLMKEVGVKPFLSTMICFPGTKERDAMDTIGMILKSREIAPELGCRIFFYTPYPGTKMYEDALKQGMIEPASLEEWASHTLRKFHAPWISKKTRVFLRSFMAYYFPFSIEPTESKNPIKNIAKKIFHKIASWRVKNRIYALPLDAMFVTRYMSKHDDVISDYEI
ncbi:MAG TPA: radical SAM protein, partial [bacterium]|nr:radical SAM protein [bacterium]